MTAGNICPARGECEDIREGAGAGRGAEEDEVRRQPVGGAPHYDADVLGEIGDENTDQYEAGGC